MVGLTYFASFAAFLILRSVGTTSLANYQLFFIPLATVCALSAMGIWHKPSIGFAAAASISLILMAIFFFTRDGNDVLTVLSNPARNTLQFVFYATTVPTFFTTFIASAIGLIRLRQRPNGKL